MAQSVKLTTPDRGSCYWEPSVHGGGMQANNTDKSIHDTIYDATTKTEMSSVYPEPSCGGFAIWGDNYWNML